MVPSRYGERRDGLAPDPVTRNNKSGYKIGRIQERGCDEVEPCQQLRPPRGGLLVRTKERCVGGLPGHRPAAGDHREPSGADSEIAGSYADSVVAAGARWRLPA